MLYFSILDVPYIAYRVSHKLGIDILLVPLLPLRITNLRFHLIFSPVL